MNPDDRYFGQFLVTSETLEVPDDWLSFAMGKWTVWRHPALPARRLVDSSGICIGFLLGHVVAADATLIPESDISVSDAVAGSPDSWEEYLYSLGGRYAAAILTSSMARMYLDPYGSLAAVYSLRSRTVGSTVTLIESAENEVSHRTWKHSVEMNSYFPAGRTISGVIKRLMPNHYLDLQEWQTVRHWPSGNIDHSADTEERFFDSVDIIVDRLQRSIGAVISEHETYIGLTCGRDSRLQLSAAKSHLDRAHFYTAVSEQPETWGNSKDVHLARRIAREQGLNHSWLEMIEDSEPLSEAAKTEYLERIGYAGNWGYAHFRRACLREQDMNRALLMGYGGEVTRAYFWTAHDTMSHRWTTKELLDRLHLPDDGPNCEAVSDWIAGLTMTDASLALELFYLENRVGCWAGAHMYGLAPFALSMIPFCHRDLVTAAYGVPIGWRKELRIEREIMRRLWPELAKYPFHSYTGLSRVLHHVAYRFGRAAKRVRRWTANSTCATEKRACLKREPKTAGEDPAGADAS